MNLSYTSNIFTSELIELLPERFSASCMATKGAFTAKIEENGETYGFFTSEKHFRRELIDIMNEYAPVEWATRG